MLLTAQAQRVVGGLLERSATVSTAESLTAGLVCATLAQVPGVSAVLRGGLVAYATDVKTGVLGVDPEVVREYGVVSRECAMLMAAQAVRLFGTDYAVSTTGVAGPDPQEGRPVGTVFVAVATRPRAAGGGAQAHDLRLTGDRQQIRESAVAAALDLLPAS